MRKKLVMKFFNLNKEQKRVFKKTLGMIYTNFSKKVENRSIQISENIATIFGSENIDKISKIDY